MPRARTLSLATLLLLPACGMKKDPVEFSGVPFCVSPDGQSTPRFAKNYIVFTHHRNGHSMGPLGSGTHGPGPLGGFYAKQLELAVVACPEDEELAQLQDGWAERLADGQIPVICPSQVLVHQGSVALETSERATALGRAGWLPFPKMELECIDGEVSFEERVLFSQIIDEFSRAVSAYTAKHEALPSSAEVVYSEMLEPELPPDPWGTALKVENTGAALVVSSAGPDMSLGTEDDIEVLSQTENGSRSTLSWLGVDDRGTGSYAQLLERRGVKPK